MKCIDRRRNGPCGSDGLASQSQVYAEGSQAPPLTVSCLDMLLDLIGAVAAQLLFNTDFRGGITVTAI